MDIYGYFNFQESSVNFEQVYISQRLELWKLIVSKTESLTTVFWVHKYLSWELNKMGELENCTISYDALCLVCLVTSSKECPGQGAPLQ